jgi:exopolysaccharide biosynthesis polyprenyl glycosylphosphotransferase
MRKPRARTKAEARHHIGVLRAHRMVEALGLQLAPALALGLLAAGHTGAMTGGVLVAAPALAVSHFVSGVSRQFRSSALAEAWLYAMPPLLGIAAASAAAVVDGHGPMLAAYSTCLLGSWLVLALGFGVKQRFECKRRVRIAVIGCREYADGLARELRGAGLNGYEVRGWITANHATISPTQRDGRLGALRDARRLVREHSIDLLVHGPAPATDPISREAVFEAIADTCLDLPVRMIEADQLGEELLGHVALANVNGAWLQYVLHPRFQPESRLGQRLMDLVLGGVAGLLALPVLAIAAVAIRLQDGGPVLYRQRRVGEAGREFTMLKLRSMRTDAEQDGVPRWCDDADRRVTAVGRLLRRTHLDELPQVWNVLRGEMTLVGPRPERPALVTQLERRLRHYDRRHLVKPGITGWAQVRCGYAGSDAGTTLKLCHDLYYLKRRSLLFDLAIMVETLRTVFAGRQYGLHVPDEQFVVGGTAA